MEADGDEKEMGKAVGQGTRNKEGRELEKDGGQEMMEREH